MPVRKKPVAKCPTIEITFLLGSISDPRRLALTRAYIFSKGKLL